MLKFFLRLFIGALWSPAGKGLTSSLSFLMFNCVTFPCFILGQVSLTWLYWFLIFATFLTLLSVTMYYVVNRLVQEKVWLGELIVP